MSTEFKNMHLFFRPKPELIKDRILTVNKNVYGMDLKTDLPSDEGYKYFLILVNYQSGMTYCKPMKTKTMEETTKCLTEIINENKTTTRGIRVICCDRGSEFNNKVMREYLAKKQVLLVLENPYNKGSMGIVERKIGVITKKMLERLGIETLKNRRNENKWRDILQEIVSEINKKAKKEPRTILADIIDEPPLIHKYVIPIGDKVYIRVKQPEQTINGKKKFINFRNGDIRFKFIQEPAIVTGYKITNNKPLRYYLNDDKSISYNDHQLLSESELHA